MNRTIIGLLLSICTISAGCAPQRGNPARFMLDHGGIIRGDVTQRRLALVFTGGSYGEGAAQILDALRDAHVKASFFMTGEFVAKPEHAPYFRRMVAEGHYVGPHSHGHLLYCPWDNRSKTLVTEQEFKTDLRTNLADLAAFGVPRRGERIYFIPPYEWFNEDQVQWSNDLDVRLFNFTPGIGSNRDWMPETETNFTPSHKILEDILAFEQRDPAGLNGAIVLLHLGSLRQDKMHRLLPQLLAELRRRGYACVRIDRLI